MAGAGAPAITLLTDYSSTGAADGLIFNLFGPFFGNFRANGPSLFSAPQPEFPSGTTVTVSLQADKVRAKDGTTPFTGNGLLQGGTLVFTMAPFSAVVLPATPLMPATADAPEMPATPAMVAFTNFADRRSRRHDHRHRQRRGGRRSSSRPSTAAPTFSVKPMGGGAWPAGATVVITVDAATTNLLDQPIDAAASVTFTAP